MLQSQVDSCENEDARNRDENYRGTARVYLKHLTHFSSHVREPQTKIINHLSGVFKQEGCRRLAPENHIPVSISEVDLALALERSGLTAEDLQYTR
jgi:hypothetical protein